MSVPKRIGSCLRTRNNVTGTALNYGPDCPRFEFQNVHMSPSKPRIQLAPEFLSTGKTGGT